MTITLAHLYPHGIPENIQRIQRALETPDRMTELLQAWKDINKDNNCLVSYVLTKNLNHRVLIPALLGVYPTASPDQRDGVASLMRCLSDYADFPMCVEFGLHRFITPLALVDKLKQGCNPKLIPDLFGSHWKTIHQHRRFVQWIYPDIAITRTLGAVIKPFKTAVHIVVSNTSSKDSTNMLLQTVEYLIYEKGVSPLQRDQKERLAWQLATRNVAKDHLKRQVKIHQELLLLCTRKAARVDQIVSGVAGFVGGDVNIRTGVNLSNVVGGKEYLKRLTKKPK